VESSYSEIVLDHARSPRNVGYIEGADAQALQVNPVCGDTLVLTLRIVDGRIAEARFKTEGCTASIAASSLLTELVAGRELAFAEALSPLDIERALGGLPPSKLHSAALVVDALRRALASYRERAPS
jgi:nitrogen fixation NifU-like protein